MIHSGPGRGAALVSNSCFPSSAGEVVSIAQLASLAGRPVSSCQGSKPVTFQLQGNKLTLSGAQIHQVPAAPARPVQGQCLCLLGGGGSVMCDHAEESAVLLQVT